TFPSAKVAINSTGITLKFIATVFDLNNKRPIKTPANPQTNRIGNPINKHTAPSLKSRYAPMGATSEEITHQRKYSDRLKERLRQKYAAAIPIAIGTRTRLGQIAMTAK